MIKDVLLNGIGLSAAAVIFNEYASNIFNPPNKKG